MIEHEEQTLEQETVRLYDDMQARSLIPLWRIEEATLTPQPRPAALAWLWKWADLYDVAQRAGRLVPMERGGDRRAIALANPGLQGKPFATPTLWAAIQWLNGHEVAPAHRHTAQAVRFIINGSGSWSTVEGDRVFLERGDFVLTPSWLWHDHGSQSDEPAVWMDALDIPLNNYLDASFFEPYPQEAQAVTKAPSTTVLKYGVGQLRATLDTSGSKVLLAPDQCIEPVLAGNVSGEWIKSKANTGRDSVVLYVHGGAFVAGSCLSSRCMSVNLAKATDLPVLSINYRLAPEHPFPAALEDVTAAYRWLLASGVRPHELIMVGDSAGGNLVLAALLSLRDAGDPLPAAAILLSPWIDLAATGRSFLALANADPYLTPPFMQVAAQNYLGNASPTMPLVSPLYGDLRGLPPMLIQVGSDEILLDDSIRLARRVNEVGGVVNLEVWQRMWRVWHYFVGAIPQGACSFAQINAFIHAVTEQNSKTHQLLGQVGSDSFLLGLEQTQLLRG